MSKLYWRKKVLLAKIEGVYGTDATPAPATDAVLAEDVEVQPMASSTEERGFDRDVLGARPQVVVGEHIVLSFSVELASSGTAGTAPALGPLLRGCSMAETIDPGVSVTYAPSSADAPESLTLALNIGGVEHRLLGARGSVEMTLRRREIPKLRFTFTGLFALPTDTAAGTPDLSAWQQPLPVRPDVTTATLAGQTPAIAEISLSLGNEVGYRDYINDAAVLRTDRQGSGSLTYDALPLATLNPFDLARSKTPVALTTTHGTTAGAIVEIQAPAIEIGAPSYSEAEGITQIRADFRPLPITGDDEVAFVFR